MGKISSLSKADSPEGPENTVLTNHKDVSSGQGYNTCFCNSIGGLTIQSTRGYYFHFRDENIGAQGHSGQALETWLQTSGCSASVTKKQTPAFGIQKKSIYDGSEKTSIMVLAR